MEPINSVYIDSLTQDSVSKTRLLNLLKLIDDSYVPKISSQVVLADYCEKLIVRADVSIAVMNDIDVGLLAIYLNDFETKSAFITSIGVLPEYREYKIGQNLLDTAIKRAGAKGFNIIKLEVNVNNSRAIRFYTKNGFMTTQSSVDGQSIFMSLKI